MCNRPDEDENIRLMKEFLCSHCIEAHDLARANQMVGNEHTVKMSLKGRKLKDIYQMESASQEMEADILSSLSREQCSKCATWIMEIHEKARCKAHSVVKGPVEQEMLFNILIAEAWKATQTYDPSKFTKFSTWVYRPWRNTISEFLRVSRPVRSLSVPLKGSGSGDAHTLGDVLEDTSSPSPLSILESKDKERGARIIGDWTKKIGIPNLLLEMLWTSDSWPCVFCRRKLNRWILDEEVSLVVQEAQVSSSYSVYSRRKLWILSAQ